MAEQEIAMFATAEVGRFFLGCRRCARVVPQFRCYGSASEPGAGLCRCGNNEFSPMVIPEWRACLWVLSCLVWRKWILRREMWDPRIAVRNLNARPAAATYERTVVDLGSGHIERIEAGAE